MFKKLAKKILFPGLDLHTRVRYRYLPQEFRQGAVKTLDAGCGNGALSYAAFCRGNVVLGISNEPESIERTKSFFDYIKTETLRFEVMNLYNLNLVHENYDQIICSETLEHIKNDTVVIQHFFRLLNIGGVLHLCCPNAVHSQHALGRVDAPEDGGHVRDGYTLESYKELLEPQGFEITKSFGVGSPIVVKGDAFLSWIRSWGGDLIALPFFLIIWPVVRWFDKINPTQPFSIYVQAIKKKESK